MSTFLELEEIARTSGIDFEATIYELAEEEQEQLARTLRLDTQRDQSSRLEAELTRNFNAGKLSRERLDMARALAADYSRAASINRNVYESYRVCRRNLERLRDQLLNDYFSQWEAYLVDLGSEVSAGLAHAVRDLWDRLKFEKLWAPTGRPRAESFLMLWDRGRHHLEIEVYASGCYDWFYRDRSSNTSTGGEDIPLVKTPPAFKAAIRKTRKG